MANPYPAIFENAQGNTRLEGQIDFTDPANQPGGSQPSVKWVDCGLVTVVSLLANGKTTLYTTLAGEFVAAVRFGATLTLPNNLTSIAFEVGDYIGRDNSATDWYAWIQPSGVVTDAAGLGIHGGEFYFNGTAGGAGNTSAVPPLQTGGFTASLSTNSNAGPTLGTTVGWQANHGYGANALIVAATHIWTAGGAGTSGGITPNFAGHIGGTVEDNDITWSDAGAVPTQGQVHVYLEIVTPA